MQKILHVIAASIALLLCLPAGADVLGDADDQYMGVQLIIPLDLNHNRLSARKMEYSAMFIHQRNAIKEGIAFTRASDGTRFLGYLRPSYDFKIGQSRIMNHAIPITHFDEYGIPYNVQNNNGRNNGAALISVIVGSALLYKVVNDVSDAIEDVSVAIVECVTGQVDCSDEADSE